MALVVCIHVHMLEVERFRENEARGKGTITCKSSKLTEQCAHTHNTEKSRRNARTRMTQP